MSPHKLTALLTLLTLVTNSIAVTNAACNVDLTTKGLPSCAQQCPEWCWATVIGEIKEYYRVNNGSFGATPVCRGYECKVVSDVRKQSCCTESTECNASSSAPLGCGNPSSPDEILQGFESEMPSKTWVHLHGKPGYSCKPGDGCWPSESTLQSLLMAGNPVARATHGHITAIAGCRQAGDLVEYRVLDSLKDPNVTLWMNWTILTLGPPPGVKPYGDGPWQNTYYVNDTGAARLSVSRPLEV